MSDLQCPATVLLLTPRTLERIDTRELRLALITFDIALAHHAAAITDLAAAHSCPTQAAEWGDGDALIVYIEQLADQYRGEQTAVIASEQAIADALEQDAPPTEPITIAVDSHGWRAQPSSVARRSP